MTEELWNRFKSDGFPRFEVSNRDQALFLIGERDLEAQLLAIKGVLHQNRQADEAVSENIKELDRYIRGHTGDNEEYQMHIESQWVDALHGSVFQDAAHSMAAVGMLAPLVESLLVSIFSALRERQHEDGNARAADARTAASQVDFWDPHFVFERGGRRIDLVAGTKQLAASIGLAEFLPDGYDTMLSALIAYRNKMFHHGLEWPIEERWKFDERLRSESWPAEWFQKSISGGEPWIFYMSATFIEHCLAIIDQILEGVGTFFGQERTTQI